MILSAWNGFKAHLIRAIYRYFLFLDGESKCLALYVRGNAHIALALIISVFYTFNSIEATIETYLFGSSFFHVFDIFFAFTFLVFTWCTTGECYEIKHIKKAL